MEGRTESIPMYALKGHIATIPQTDETLTQKGYSADAKAVGEELNKKFAVEDLIDDLNYDLVDKPLSARQGKVLKTMIESIDLSQAGTVGYSNTNSKLEAVTMQGAIDELAGKTDALDSEIDNKVSKSGGDMIEGAVNVRSAKNGYGSLNKNNSASADYGTQVVDVTNDGKTAKVCISALLGTLTYVDANGNIRDLFHEGNKAFGSYVGNGSEETQEINTGSIGRLLMVYSDTRLALVTPKGAFVVNISAGTFEWIDGEKVWYLNGVLTLATTSVAFNNADVTYYYQAI